VEEYGKKLPVRIVVEDDKSDLDTSMSILEKFMTEDKVDFVFSPATDEFIHAARDLTNQYGYLLLQAEGSGSDIRFHMEDYPLVFGMLNFSDFYQLARLKMILPKLGATSIAVIYPENDLHGAEYLSIMHHEADEVDDLSVIFEVGFPAGTTDFKPLLEQAQDSGADCLLLPCQPQDNYTIVNQMIEMGYNPNMLVTGPGTTVTAFADAVGGQTNVDGICAYGAWSVNSSPELAALKDTMLNSPALKAAGFTEANVNYWYAAYFMAGLDVFKQAIEKAGTLDNAKVAEVLNTETFPTLIGDTNFDRQMLAMPCHPGEMGQWQNGVFEVIDPGPTNTADPIYPKPPWPGS
jgi:branched-chain amino acid transport system substrate-binding protein